jgi:hypothetical protein
LEECPLTSIKYLILTLSAALAAHADFSYISVSKTPAGARTSKHYIKGQKTITDDGDHVMIMDLDAQTMTTVNRTRKTYSVKTFSELFRDSTAAGTKVDADVKKTGQHRNINGFDAEEMVVTMMADNAQSSQPGPKTQMQMEMHFWLASDVPGIEEMRAFYQKNADRLPWAAMSGGMSGMAEVQRKLATMHGVAVLTVVKMGGLDPAKQAQLDQARARIEEMKKQGGQQAAMADQILAKIGGGSPEISTESSGFSAAPVSDAVFAIPADYKKVDK